MRAARAARARAAAERTSRLARATSASRRSSVGSPSVRQKSFGSAVTPARARGTVGTRVVSAAESAGGAGGSGGIAAPGGTVSAVVSRNAAGTGTSDGR